MTTTRTSRTTRTTHRLALTLLGPALAGGLLVVAPTSPASAEPPPTTPPTPAALPAPTGPLDVATRTLHVVDRDRRDPWAGGPRHLVVTLTYPARDDDGPRSAYMTRRESRALLAFQTERGFEPPAGIPRGILARTRTGATDGAAPLRRAGGRPLVLLSPGFSLVRSSLTSLATDLASRGYVAAQVSHAHEDSGTELPDGRLLRCLACETEDYPRVAQVRSRDLSVVLDRLTRPGSGTSALVDERRVGAVGHSIGGNAALTLAADDRRVDAAVDMDGTVVDPVHRRLRTPAMLLGTADLHAPGGDDRTWDRTWRRLAGARTWLTVTDGNHGSFTDNPLLVEQLSGQRDPLPGARAVAVTRAYVGAFLDRHLRDRRAPLLDGPSPAYPEVRHHAP